MNYKESSVVGTEYVRCNGVRIVNPLGKTPAIMFSEEKVTILPTDTICIPAGELVASYDPAKVVNLINPVTGESLNQTTTYADLYVMLFSAWQQEAQARDNAQPTGI